MSRDIDARHLIQKLEERMCRLEQRELGKSWDILRRALSQLCKLSIEGKITDEELEFIYLGNQKKESSE